MPKKKHSSATFHSVKPGSTPHPSLTSSSLHAHQANPQNGPKSVNETLQTLRSQSLSAAAKASPPQPETPSNLYGAYGTQSTSPSEVGPSNIPRAAIGQSRNGRRPRQRRTRNPPGPAVPQSWLRRASAINIGLSPGHNSVASWQEERSGAGAVSKGLKWRCIEPLPGLVLPEEGSLVDLCLRRLARDWNLHLEYDGAWLGEALHTRHKSILLYYLAREKRGQLSLEGLKTLLGEDSDQEAGAGGPQQVVSDLTSLDLATSIGKSITLAELQRCVRPDRKQDALSIQETTQATQVSENWDDVLPAMANISVAPSTQPLHFSNLTQLSLGHPAPDRPPSWKALLNLAPHLATLTHLSLAFWPLPTLTPNASTAFVSTPRGTVQYSATHYYSSMDGDFTEAASIFRRLGRHLTGLAWLDLTGCWPWIQCLASDELDWAHTWRSLVTVKAAQGWDAEVIASYDLAPPSMGGAKMLGLAELSKHPFSNFHTICCTQMITLAGEENNTFGDMGLQTIPTGSAARARPASLSNNVYQNAVSRLFAAQYGCMERKLRALERSVRETITRQEAKSAQLKLRLSPVQDAYLWEPVEDAAEQQHLISSQLTRDLSHTAASSRMRKVTFDLGDVPPLITRIRAHG